MMVRNINGLEIAGLSFRTTNEELLNSKGAKLLETIGEVLEKKDKDSKLYIIYSNYAHDFAQNIAQKEMKVTVGLEVSEKGNFKIIPQKYEVFETEQGKLSEIVYKKWLEIWADKELLEKRSFGTDFEVYTGQEDPENGKIEIYIGINN